MEAFLEAKSNVSAPISWYSSFLVVHLQFTQEQFYFIKTSNYFFSVYIFNFTFQKITFQNRIDNKYFSWPVFTVTLTKNILTLSNCDSIINFKFRSFIARFNFFSQSRMIIINRLFNNRIMIRIIVLLY